MFYFWFYIWIGIFIGVPLAGWVYRECYIEFTEGHSYQRYGLTAEDRFGFIGWALAGFAISVLFWLPVLTLIVLGAILWFVGLALIKVFRLKQILEPEVKR